MSRAAALWLAAAAAPSLAWQLPSLTQPGRCSTRRSAPPRAAETGDGKMDLGAFGKLGEAGGKLGKKLTADTCDLTNPSETFELLCSLSGVPYERDAVMDIDGFVLAFEQLFNSGMPFDPDAIDLLKLALGSERDEDVSGTDWAGFHRQWQAGASMEAHLEGKLAAKRAEEEAKKKERDFRQKLAKAKQDAQAQMQRPELMADMAKKQRDALDGQLGAVERAAQHRSLDPANWAEVTDGVGGLHEPLESIRRRIWVPLCAPLSLLNELGAERVKGLLLYGPPGCGKSLLASRLAAGLSRRPPTLVSGPEVMDKYVGNSEAQLRTLFTMVPKVPQRPGDAADVMMVAEATELHVIVLDEFDAIARKRSNEASSSEGGGAARDSVVNQLLALMDGVSALPVRTLGARAHPTVCCAPPPRRCARTDPHVRHRADQPARARRPRRAAPGQARSSSPFSCFCPARTCGRGGAPAARVVDPAAPHALSLAGWRCTSRSASPTRSAARRSSASTRRRCESQAASRSTARRVAARTSARSSASTRTRMARGSTSSPRVPAASPARRLPRWCARRSRARSTVRSLATTRRAAA